MRPTEKLSAYVGRVLRYLGVQREVVDLPPVSFPFANNRNRDEVCVPLLQTFRFVHEPIGATSAPRFVGRQNELETLAKRILFSEGGAFLVTGYRGVGKTSFVNQVVRKLEEALPWAERHLGKTEIVDIYLNVARPVQPSEIMHHIIRRLHDRLVELGILSRLADSLREALTLAYHRTSLNMVRKLAESSEKSFGLNEASIGGDVMKAAVKLGWSSKRSRTQNYEMSYLGYDDKAAEHDIISLCRLISAGYNEPLTALDRLRRSLRGLEQPRVGLKIVFIFDELDKLEEFTAKGDGNEKPVIDQILGALKNLFTTSGVTFVFVAGKDLQERWLEDVGKGDSVYESVFSYDKYLPCLWTDVELICDRLVDEKDSLAFYDRQVFREFKKYLAYKGRGIPRRIIRTFNEYVEWDGEHPNLVFNRQDIRKIRFFAGLQDALAKNEKTLFGESHEESIGTQSDKRRLGVYYLIDWIMRQGALEFTLNEVLSASKRLSAKIALAEEIAPRVAERIVKILLKGDYIQEVEKPAYRVFIGTANAIDEGDTAKKYRISPRRLAEMGGVAGDSESDADVMASVVSSVGRERAITSIAKYKIDKFVGEGGMGRVYAATDQVLGRKVALKIMPEDKSPDLQARFEREVLIMSQLNHPNIVRLYDSGKDDGRSYIAMEFLDGSTLTQMISGRGRFELELAVTIIKPLIDAVGHIHQQGFVRCDVKPDNVILTSTGRVCLVDLGIAKPAPWRGDTLKSGFVTRTGWVIGTPVFMAPEQFDGTVDQRSDIYSLGLMLYKMLTGSYPFEGSPSNVIRAQLEQTPSPPSAYVSLPEAIDRLILKCLERDPEKRFQTAVSLREALDEATGDQPPVDLSSVVNVVRNEVKAIEKMDQMPTFDPTIAGPDIAVIADHSMASAIPITPTLAGSSTARAEASVPSELPSPSPASLETRPRLTLVKGNRADVGFQQTVFTAHYLLEKETTIGRGSENAIVLRDVRVSRYHAKFVVRNEGWFIEDFNSSLGTYVNGEKILVPRLLRDGDEIRIGDFVFRFNEGSATS